MISLKAVMEVSIYHFHFDTSNIIQINPRLLLICIVGCDIFISYILLIVTDIKRKRLSGEQTDGNYQNSGTNLEEFTTSMKNKSSQESRSFSFNGGEGSSFNDTDENTNGYTVTRNLIEACVDFTKIKASFINESGEQQFRPPSKLFLKVYDEGYIHLNCKDPLIKYTLLSSEFDYFMLSSAFNFLNSFSNTFVISQVILKLTRAVVTFV